MPDNAVAIASEVLSARIHPTGAELWSLTDGRGREYMTDADPAFWTVDLVLAELDALLAHLGIAGSYHLLGQSWGGMLGAEHAVRQPAGLRSLTIANSPP